MNFSPLVSFAREEGIFKTGKCFNIARAFLKIINLASSTFLESKIPSKSDRHNRNANKMQLVIPYFVTR